MLTLYSARVEVVMDRWGPLHGCPRIQMLLGLAPDFAVEEGSKNEPEGQVVVMLVVLVLILTADTPTHPALC